MYTKTELPEGIAFKATDTEITISLGDVKLSREYPKQYITFEHTNNTIVVTPVGKSSKAKAIAGSFSAHIRNMIVGMQKPFVYTLKAVYTHFPMTLQVKDNTLVVQNFFGEKRPRQVKLPKGIKIEITGDELTITSNDIELAGQAAAKIEGMTRLSNKDRRIYQDGIYITMKAGKPIR